MIENTPTLYIVATPIGNLEDITMRALRILREVDIVLAEDTRVTNKLLRHYDIMVRTVSYHGNSTKGKEDIIIKYLEEGKTIALVSDAGTPAISDPGSRLVSLVREHFDNEINIITIPGPSAVTSALSVAGVPASKYVFMGFLPKKKGRETLFEQIGESTLTIVFYESPHRIVKTLQRLRDYLSSKRIVAVARELTKIHEQVIAGKPEEVYEYFLTNPDKIKGEFVVIVGP